MMPKYMMANISIAAVPDIDFTESITMSPMPRPAPANRPKMVGTMIRASNGVMRLVMMRAMNVAIIANPRATSMGILLGSEVWNAGAVAVESSAVGRGSLRYVRHVTLALLCAQSGVLPLKPFLLIKITMPS